MKYNRTIFFLIIFSSACGQKSNSSLTNSETSNKKEYANNIEETLNEDFILFWNSFRSAIIESDYTKIENLTNFPLRTRGEMDSDSIILYDKLEFKRILNAYLNQPTWSKGKGQITQLKEIELNIKPDSTVINDMFARIGNMVFKYEKDQWKLEFIYLNIRDDEFWKR